MSFVCGICFESGSSRRGRTEQPDIAVHFPCCVLILRTTLLPIVEKRYHLTSGLSDYLILFSKNERDC